MAKRATPGGVRSNAFTSANQLPADASRFPRMVTCNGISAVSVRMWLNKNSNGGLAAVKDWMRGLGV